MNYGNLIKHYGKYGECMDFFNGKRVLVTGHTGFKGGWLSLWLLKTGANVLGYALKPYNDKSIYSLTNLSKNMISVEADINDQEHLMHTLLNFQPEIVFHLAAQPLVRLSYKTPIYTLKTNIIGTSCLFDCLRYIDSVKVIVNVTSDKCYENHDNKVKFNEADKLGGYDPYSCSKACSELITSCFRNSYFQEKDVAIATARAGNIIGGGDWSEDRLIPDVINAYMNNNAPILRSPDSIREWQYVLEPLKGYMILAKKMWEDRKSYSQAFNFSTDYETITVGEIVKRLEKLWPEAKPYVIENKQQPHESKQLKLDCKKSRELLDFNTHLSLDEALEWTVYWYKSFQEGFDMEKVSIDQLDKYQKLGDNLELKK